MQGSDRADTDRLPPRPLWLSRGLFDGVFARGGADTGDQAWLTAMLQTEAALARALERAGLAPAGAGAAVTEAARAGAIDAAELGRQAALTGNPVPALVRALAGERARGRGGGRAQGRDQPGHHRHGRHAARPERARGGRGGYVGGRGRHGGARRRGTATRS